MHSCARKITAHEINTSLVAAASRLHPRVRQPDGAVSIHVYNANGADEGSGDP
ncbi:hypothetical protein [Streptomyces sp. NPDC002580]|uniref:hypothetical protein n=1 Tax=Streptomyces sp. NPDC002580 TaxID=3364653 RepID=UPI0036862FE1